MTGPVRSIEFELPETPEAPGVGQAPETFRARAALDEPFPSVARAPDGTERALCLDRRTESGGLSGCLACGHPELYTRKDFPRALGLGVVVVAAVLAPWTRYLSLVAAAAIDFLLYHFGPEVVACYVCDARHRGFPPTPRHPRFDIEIAERLKYGDKAVMGKPMRPGGTAGAPEPEH